MCNFHDIIILPLRLSFNPKIPNLGIFWTIFIIHIKKIPVGRIFVNIRSTGILI
uniref:Uncharacterized protein n=1 Tax=Myoviridae sp. ctgEf1 TaxID=2827699 RepID=A0A8S5SLJ9_9CAUD|nr:MAG TPA: hypothetical protein [Myoviridae sp. ctgEf1]